MMRMPSELGLHCVTCMNTIHTHTQCKTVTGENFGEFGEMNVIHQYFTQLNYRSNELAIG